MKKHSFFLSNPCFFALFNVAFDYFSFNFGAVLTFYGNPEIQDGGSKFAAIDGNNDVIITSYDVFTSRRGR